LFYSALANIAQTKSTYLKEPAGCSDEFLTTKLTAFER